MNPGTPCSIAEIRKWLREGGFDYCPWAFKDGRSKELLVWFDRYEGAATEYTALFNGAEFIVATSDLGVPYVFKWKNGPRHADHIKFRDDVARFHRQYNSQEMS